MDQSNLTSRKQQILKQLSHEHAEVSVHNQNISDLLQQLADITNGPDFAPIVKSIDYSKIDFDHVDVKIYAQIVEIYAQAERNRIARGKQRKSARQVSVSIDQTVIGQLEKDFGSQFDFARQGKYILISLKGTDTTFVILRVAVDLGFARGEEWRRLLSEDIKMANTYGVTIDHLFIITLACINSFADDDIEKRLGESIHKSELLADEQRNKLATYLADYKASFNDLAEGLSNQLFFESANNHPNGDGTNLAKDPQLSIDYEHVIYEKGFKAVYETLMNA